ncbi:hypothetical protein MFC_01425 [Mesomycoplasma flocculare ATCC 27716]|nr:hypothetical protein MFC_01425 [Mesomycoplasma flocculare ATCC 27716]
MSKTAGALSFFNLDSLSFLANLKVVNFLGPLVSLTSSILDSKYNPPAFNFCLLSKVSVSSGCWLLIWLNSLVALTPCPLRLSLK